MLFELKFHQLQSFLGQILYCLNEDVSWNGQCFGSWVFDNKWLHIISSSVFILKKIFQCYLIKLKNLDTLWNDYINLFKLMFKCSDFVLITFLCLSVSRWGGYLLMLAAFTWLSTYIKILLDVCIFKIGMLYLQVIPL